MTNSSTARAGAGLAALLGFVVLLGVPIDPRRATADGARPWTVEARLDARSHELPAGVPSVLVHAPAELDPEAAPWVVVFVHGWRGCARQIARAGPVRCGAGAPPRQGWDLVGRHDRARQGSLFLVPQLAWVARDSSPGRFAEAGFARAWLKEVLDRALTTRLPGTRSVDDVARVSLVAHSAGYAATLAILERGGLDARVRDVVLLDALYAGVPQLVRWARGAPARRLVTLHTGGGSPARHSRALARALRSDLGPELAVDPQGSLADAVATHRVVVARSRHPHGALPRAHLTEVLRGLGSERAPAPEAIAETRDAR